MSDHPHWDTPEFKQWFGESKVVDEAGKPLTVYHGTNSDFDTFKPGGNDKTRSGPAIWFTGPAHREAPPAFHNTNPSKTGAKVIPVVLKITNPLVIDNQTSREWAQSVYGNDSKEFPFLLKQHQVESIIKDGYDGIVFHHSSPEKELPVISNADEFIAFHPHQVKSATANKGSYNPNDNRIQYSEGEAMTTATKSGPIDELFDHLSDFTSPQGTVDLDNDYARTVYNSLHGKAGRSGVYDLSDELGSGAIGYHGPEGIVSFVPPKFKGDDWDVRYALQNVKRGEPDRYIDEPEQYAEGEPVKPGFGEPVRTEQGMSVPFTNNQGKRVDVHTYNPDGADGMTFHVKVSAPGKGAYVLKHDDTWNDKHGEIPEHMSGQPIEMLHYGPRQALEEAKAKALTFFHQQGHHAGPPYVFDASTGWNDMGDYTKLGGPKTPGLGFGNIIADNMKHAHEIASADESYFPINVRNKITGHSWDYEHGDSNQFAGEQEYKERGIHGSMQGMIGGLTGQEPESVQRPKFARAAPPDSLLKMNSEQRRELKEQMRSTIPDDPEKQYAKSDQPQQYAAGKTGLKFDPDGAYDEFIAPWLGPRKPAAAPSGKPKGGTFGPYGFVPDDVDSDAMRRGAPGGFSGPFGASPGLARDKKYDFSGPLGKQKEKAYDAAHAPDTNDRMKRWSAAADGYRAKAAEKGMPDKGKAYYLRKAEGLDKRIAKEGAAIPKRREMAENELKRLDRMERVPRDATGKATDIRDTGLPAYPDEVKSGRMAPQIARAEAAGNTKEAERLREMQGNIGKDYADAGFSPDAVEEFNYDTRPQWERRAGGWNSGVARPMPSVERTPDGGIPSRTPGDPTRRDVVPSSTASPPTPGMLPPLPGAMPSEPKDFDYGPLLDGATAPTPRFETTPVSDWTTTTGKPIDNRSMPKPSSATASPTPAPAMPSTPAAPSVPRVSPDAFGATSPKTPIASTSKTPTATASVPPPMEMKAYPGSDKRPAGGTPGVWGSAPLQKMMAVTPYGASVMPDSRKPFFQNPADMPKTISKGPARPGTDYGPKVEKMTAKPMASTSPTPIKAAKDSPDRYIAFGEQDPGPPDMSHLGDLGPLVGFLDLPYGGNRIKADDPDAITLDPNDFPPEDREDVTLESFDLPRDWNPDDDEPAEYAKGQWTDYLVERNAKEDFAESANNAFTQWIRNDANVWDDYVAPALESENPQEALESVLQDVANDVEYDDSSWHAPIIEQMISHIDVRGLAADLLNDHQRAHNVKNQILANSVDQWGPEYHSVVTDVLGPVRDAEQAMPDWKQYHSPDFDPQDLAMRLYDKPYPPDIDDQLWEHTVESGVVGDDVHRALLHHYVDSRAYENTENDDELDAPDVNDQPEQMSKSAVDPRSSLSAWRKWKGQNRQGDSV